MPMPWTYRQATREWQAFLVEARAAMGLTSDNVTYTAVQGVLRAFRRRLTPQQAIDFAQVQLRLAQRTAGAGADGVRV